MLMKLLTVVGLAVYSSYMQSLLATKPFWLFWSGAFGLFVVQHFWRERK